MPSTNESTHQAFFNSAPGKLLTKVIFDNIDQALANAKRLQSSSVAKGGGKDIAEWKKDCALLKKARAGYAAEVKALRNGKADSLKTIDEAQHEIAEILEWVEHRNHAYQMVVDADLEAKLAVLLPVLGLLTSDGANAINLQRKLEQITKDLKAAEKASKSKAAKAALTVVLVAAGMMLPPLGMAGSMFALAGTLVASDMGGRAIDYAVGVQSGPPDALKSAYTVADSSIASAGQVSKTAESLGKKSAAIGVAWDATDAGYAIYKQKNLEKRLNDFVKEAKASALAMEKRAKKVKALQKEALAALNKARANAKSFRSSASAREKVIKDFQRYHDLN